MLGPPARQPICGVKTINIHMWMHANHGVLELKDDSGENEAAEDVSKAHNRLPERARSDTFRHEQLK